MAQQMNKFWNVKSLSGDVGELTLQGTVERSRPIDWFTGEATEGLFISPEGFLEDLEQLKDKKEIIVKLDSTGGDVFTAVAIHNELKGFDATITVIVVGTALSAGSVLMCCGDTVKAYAGSLIMGHEVATFASGHYSTTELQKIIKGNDACERAIADIYAGKSGIDVERLRSMMKENFWLTGSEAQELGFVDEVIGEGEVVITTSSARDTLYVNGVARSSQGIRIPANIPIMKGGATTITNLVGGSEMAHEVKITSAEQLKQAYPEWVNDLTKSAVESALATERERIKEIESIAPSVADENLINAAKFDHPVNAAQLALQAMQAQAQLGAVQTKKTEEDYRASNANQVAAVQPEADPTQESFDYAKRIANLVNQGGK